MFDATPLLRLFAGHRLKKLAHDDAQQTQRLVLLRLLRRARHTEFGQKHRFADISDITTFQRRVPLRHYEDFWREYWGRSFPILKNLCWPGTIPYFALTSGTTTGKTKYIPVSREMIASNKRGVLDAFTYHLRAHPKSRVLAGKNFMLGGSTSLKQEAPGIYSGDLSGIAAREVPWWVRPWFFPSLHYALIADWETKIDTLARLALHSDIRTIAGTPSWVLLFFAKLAEIRPDLPTRTTSYFPNLELFLHGGVNFEPYRRQFENLFQGSTVDMREVYTASEGFIAVADRGYGEGLRLMTDHGIFYEFVPVEEIESEKPPRHWLGSVEQGVNYAVVLSTCAGLWSYVLGDTVRFVERHPPRILVTGRLSYFLSVFGEHLIGEEIEAAVETAASAIGQHVVDYTVTPIYPSEPGQRGGHLFFVEFSTRIDDLSLTRFAQALDHALGDQNEDYRTHRLKDFGMAAPRIAAVLPGSFAAWLKAQGKLGGQNKVPRVLHDPAAVRALEEFLEREQRIYGATS
ncbi:MAG: GH3 auxin-responsive promoter family protein [Acidobacteriia bacterium]|nr:GH3 auxin-responsive promoter family protein [Methyloceanibacter sp.]MCL6490827.1 GH3 auxin-responsive promoter family protein [Terriglobia bacterium]